MNKNDIIRLALKIGAIVIVVSSLSKIPPFFDYLDKDYGVFPSVSNVMFGLMPIIISLFISACMWFYPNQLLSNVFLRNEIDESTNVSDSVIGELLISILGLYVLSYAIPDIIFHIVFYINIEGYRDALRARDYASFVATIVEFVLGVYLIYGSKIVNNFIRQIKKEVN